MNTTTFLILLSSFSVISGLVTEGIKNIVTDKVNLSYNIAVYYQLNTIPFTVNNIIYIILMGLASGLVSMVGFDKVKQAFEQLSNKKV